MLTLMLTGCPRSEVLELTGADVRLEAAKAFYSYLGKGGKNRQRELREGQSGRA